MTVAAASPRRHPARLPIVWLLGAMAFTVATAAIAVLVGPASLPAGQTVRILLDALPGITVDHDVTGPLAAVVTEVRLPRVVLAGIVGTVLAAAGGAYQATFGTRSPTRTCSASPPVPGSV